MGLGNMGALGWKRADLPWFSLGAVGLAASLMASGTYDSTVSGRVLSVTYGGIIGDSPWSGGLSVIAACLALAAALHRRRREVRPGPAGCAALCACIGVPLAILLSLTGSGVSNTTASGASGDDALSVACGMVLSAASTVLLALWVQELAHQGRGRALTVLAAALCIDVAFGVIVEHALVSSVGNLAVLAAATVAPLLYLRFAGLRGRSAPAAADRSGEEGKATAGAAPSAGEPALPRSAFDVPFWLSLALIAIYCLGMGTIQSLGAGAVSTDGGLFSWLSPIDLCALLTAAVAALVAPMRGPHGVLRVAVLVVLMFAVYLSAAFGSQMEPFGVLSMTMVRMLIVLYVWLIACDIPWRNGWPAYAFAMGWGAFTACNTLFTKVGLALGQGVAARAAFEMSAVAGLAALVLIELAARRVYADGLAGVPGADTALAAHGSAAGTGGGRPDERSAQEDPVLPQCRRLAVRYGLTARELEVLVPLVHGRSAATIAQMLEMSTETARTHIRHIYQKTDIHNREDLMDEVEAQPLG